MSRRYVILGMGAAGIGAAEAIRSQDKQGEIVCVSAEKEGYYSRPGLAYFLSKELAAKSLFPFSQQDFQNKGIRQLHLNAVRLDPENKEVVFSDGKKLRYDRVLLAVGAEAVRPKLEGMDLDGVVYLDSIQQTELMVRKARWQKRAVVVGGGITALEIVEGLMARGVKVDFFIRGERYWNRVLDEVESRIVQRRLREEGVRVHLNTQLARILGRSGKIVGVETQDGRRIPTKMVAFAIGVRPRLGLAKSSGLEVGRGVRVNPYMQTSHPDVFAAGDVAEVYDPDSGEWIVDSLWPVARQQGMAAGMNMAGKQQQYRRKSPLNVTRLTGVTTTIIGKVGTGEPEDEFAIVRGESETWQLRPDAVVCQNRSDVNRVRVLVGDQKLLGALLMGDQGLSRPLEELVAAEADITPIRESLTHPGADLRQILFNFWQDWRNSFAN